jgi:3-phosphoshikimate 1-carboxyvinyltransferase
MTFGPRGPLRGASAIPGDKSISHRALMVAAMACGHSRIEGLSEGSDVESTAAALRAMGVRIHRGAAAVTVNGVGTGCLLPPETPLDMSNSGTSTRLLMGLAASHNVTATFTGDASLSRRPMERAAAPLRRLGAEIVTSPDGRLPLTVRGACPAVPRSFRLDVVSAQVKSALLLAGLNTPGITEVVEPVATRDHTERMLKLFGADIQRDGASIRIRGEATLRPRSLRVPGDPSSAAFLIVAALVVPGSEVRIENVCVNPMRIGLFEALRRMGAALELGDVREVDGEPVAAIEARHSRLAGIVVPAEAVPAMIDEFPIFFIAAAFAEGETRARGLAELRVKESDRIAAIGEGLRAAGVEATIDGEGLAVRGSGGRPIPGGATIQSRLDHRIAMSFAVAGLHAREPITVDDMSPVATSFPGFTAALAALAPA